MLTPTALLAASLAVAAAAPPAGPTTAPTRGKAATTTSAKTPTNTASKATGGKPTTPAAKAKAANGGKTAPPKTKPKQKPGEVMELDWSDLLPENERAHFSASAPPPQHGPLGEGGPPAVQKVTTTFNEDLADMVVRMPGFLVPIGTPRDGLVTEFLLVPYIGACIHVPPPPPNQMVYVTSESGIATDAIHEAYWVTGKMRVESRTTALGTAAYAVTATKVERYEY
jgi:hypothetical protein